jgi:hypothetical protein
MAHCDFLIEEGVSEAPVPGGVEKVPDGGLVSTDIPDSKADHENQKQDSN